jgi:short-subunit dehydrogenase
LDGKRVIVTGASQGIGRSLALQAAKRGAKVVAAARTLDLLNTLKSDAADAPGQILPVVADVADPAGRKAMVEAALSQFGGLDLLINNAGIGATGQFMDSEPETLRRIFEVNYFGLAELCRLCIPHLKSGHQPMIVNISSVVGRRALPGRSLYSSSKFAVAGFTEALRAELSLDNISVLVVNPGLTQTNFSQNLLERKAKIQLDHLRGMTSDQVAEYTLNAVEADKREITLTRGGKALVLAGRFFPRLVDRIAKRKVRELFAEEIAQRAAKKA